MKKLIALIFLLTFKHGYSQSVDDYPMADQDTIIHGKKLFDITFGLTMNGGNNPLYGGTIKSTFTYEHPNWEFSISPSFNMNYASVNDEITLVRREGYVVTTISKIQNKWKIGGISEVEHSFLKKIDVRFNAGAGPSFKLVKNKEFELSVSEYVLAEGLKATNKPMNNYFVLRTSTRIKAVYKHKLFSVTSINLVQPALYTNQGISTSEHFIFRTANKIDFSVAKSISLGVQIDGKYEAYPTHLNTNLLPFDWNSAIALTYKFE
jgi:hypothetical protein